MKRFVLYFFVLFFVISCKKNHFTIQNLNNNQILIFGHGGMGETHVHPMDTYESFMKSLECGADGLEMDVQMTKDSVLIAFHNQTMDDNTQMKGLVNSYTWEELKNNYYKNPSFTKYYLVKIDDVLKNVKDKETKFFYFDCKPYAQENKLQYFEVFSRKLIEIIDVYGIEEHIFIDSQNIDFLNMVKSAKPNYKTLISNDKFSDAYPKALQNNFTGVSTSLKHTSNAEIEMAHSAGFWVALFNINSIGENKKAIKKNPEIIISDRIKNINKQLEK